MRYCTFREETDCENKKQKFVKFVERAGAEIDREAEREKKERETHLHRGRHVHRWID